MADAIAAARPKPGWYYGWTIVAVLVLSQVSANALTYNTFPQYVPLWSAQLHILPSTLQLAMMLMLIGASPASVIVGGWADKYPARRLFAVGLIGMALFYLAISFVTAWWQILVLYGLLAAPAVTMSTAVTGNALISRWFVRRLGLALGISTCGTGLATAILPKIVAHFLPEVGWRTIWRVGALLVAVVVMPLVVWVIRERPTHREGMHFVTIDGAGPMPAVHGHVGGASAGATPLGWREVFRRRNFWLVVAIYLIMIGTGTAFIQNMGTFAKSRNMSLQDTGTMLAMVGVAHVFASLVMGALSDRFGNRLPLAGMALAVGCGIGFLAIGHSLPVLALGAALIGLNAAVFTPLSSAIALEFGAGGFGRAFGLAMMFVPLSQIFPFGVARTAELTGSYLPAMAVCAAILVCAAGLSLMLRENGRVQA